jgi:hypothetical protein
VGNVTSIETWWYELVVDDVDVENDADDDGCDDTGKGGDFISTCSALGTDYCSGAYDSSSCCYTTGLITGVAMVGSQPYSACAAWTLR